MTDLKVPCPHGYYDAHGFDSEFCPGGSLLPPDSLVVIKEDGAWPYDRVELDEDGDVRRIRPNDPHRYGNKVAWLWTEDDENHSGYPLVPLDALAAAREGSIE